VADLSITAANVIPQSNANIIPGTAGATITAGNTVYYDSGSGTYKLALCSAVAASATLIGIAMNGASSGQPVDVMISGDVAIGATVIEGTGYYLSGNAGMISTTAITTSTFYPSFVGMAINTTTIRLAITAHNNVPMP
jgi:hypothetical protein